MKNMSAMVLKTRPTVEGVPTSAALSSDSAARHNANNNVAKNSSAVGLLRVDRPRTAATNIIAGGAKNIQGVH